LQLPAALLVGEPFDRRVVEEPAELDPVVAESGQHPRDLLQRRRRLEPEAHAPAPAAHLRRSCHCPPPPSCRKLETTCPPTLQRPGRRRATSEQVTVCYLLWWCRMAEPFFGLQSELVTDCYLAAAASVHQQPAVDVDLRPVDEARRVGCEEDGDCRDLVRSGDAAEGRRRHEPGAHLRGPGGRERRVDDPGAEGVRRGPPRA